MVRITKAEVKERTEQVTCFLLERDAASYRQIADHLQLSEATFYQWMWHQLRRPGCRWYRTDTGLLACRRLSRIQPSEPVGSEDLSWMVTELSQDIPAGLDAFLNVLRLSRLRAGEKSDFSEMLFELLDDEQSPGKLTDLRKALIPRMIELTGDGKPPALWLSLAYVFLDQDDPEIDRLLYNWASRINEPDLMSDILSFTDESDLVA